MAFLVGVALPRPHPARQDHLAPLLCTLGLAALAGLSDGAPPSPPGGGGGVAGSRRCARRCCGRSMPRGWRGRTRGRRGARGAAEVAGRACRRERCRPSAEIARILDRVAAGERLAEPDIVALFDARGQDFTAVCRAADRLRARARAATPSPTSSTATSTTPTSAPTAASSAPSPRAGTISAIAISPTTCDLEEIANRTAEAWQRGATEVCLQGGIQPGYTGDTYLGIVGAVKSAAPDIHVHAFSPLEICTAPRR